MKFEDLSPELRQKAQECKTTEELLVLAKEEGYELSDAELEEVSGGWETCFTNYECSSLNQHCVDVS